jgi:hypothetical protein
MQVLSKLIADIFLLTINAIGTIIAVFRVLYLIIFEYCWKVGKKKSSSIFWKLERFIDSTRK